MTFQPDRPSTFGRFLELVTCWLRANVSTRSSNTSTVRFIPDPKDAITDALRSLAASFRAFALSRHPIAPPVSSYGHLYSPLRTVVNDRGARAALDQQGG